MPKAGGTGTRSSVRAAEKAALEAEQAAAVVDAETTAKEAQAEAAAAAEELAAYRAQVESAVEEAQQKAAAELAELKERRSADLCWCLAPSLYPVTLLAYPPGWSVSRGEG